MPGYPGYIKPEERSRVPSMFGLGDLLSNLVGKAVLGGAEGKGYELLNTPGEEQLVSHMYGLDPVEGPLTYAEDNIFNIVRENAPELQSSIDHAYAKALALQNYQVNPDTGEIMLYGRHGTPLLGDMYFDAEGNVSDYWNIGLDKYEDPYDPVNLKRRAAAYFSDPAYVNATADLSLMDQDELEYYKNLVTGNSNLNFDKIIEITRNRLDELNKDLTFDPEDVQYIGDKGWVHPEEYGYTY